MKKLVYTEEELPQRSEEWLEMRKTCVGGSDMATILGLTPKFGSPYTLWKRKTGRLAPKKANAATERGNLMEKEAIPPILEELQSVYDIKNPKLEQFFAKHPEFDYMGISFDGVDIENKYVVEIKCPKYSWNFKTVWENGVQDYYYPQLQAEIYVANAIWGINKAFYCSYFPDGAYILDNTEYTEHFKTLCVLDVDLDELYCEEMRKVAKVFYDFVEHDYWDKKKYEEILEEFNKNVNRS